MATKKSKGTPARTTLRSKATPESKATSKERGHRSDRELLRECDRG
jgi:hypothetical protein